MKKPNLRKLYLFLLVSVLVISFTSCENEDYTETGKLVVDTYDFNPVPVTDYRGITIPFEMDLRDIRGYSSYNRLYRIDLYSSFLTIESDVLGRNDDVQVRLWSTGVSEYVGTYIPDNRGVTQISSGSDVNYRRFMQSLMDKLYAEGHLRLMVTVSVNTYQSIPFDLEIDNNLDLRIRD